MVAPTSSCAATRPAWALRSRTSPAWLPRLAWTCRSSWSLASDSASTPYHGVAHTQVLENLAAIDRNGGYLGAVSIPSASREAVLYRDAVAHAQAANPLRPSIVNGQIAAATR